MDLGAWILITRRLGEKEERAYRLGFRRVIGGDVRLG
jgi:hypothetical protein